MKKHFLLVIFLLVAGNLVNAQNRGLTNTSASKYAKMTSTDIDGVKWTNGFWAERFSVFKDTMILSMWKTLDDPDISHMYRNFEVAAGDVDGDHGGPPFHDGDF